MRVFSALEPKAARYPRRNHQRSGHFRYDKISLTSTPQIRGTRVPVSVIVGSIADGDTREQVLQAWPVGTRGYQSRSEVRRGGVKQRRPHSSLSRRGELIARAKVDEDLPHQIADLLAARGHDATTVLAQGWQVTPDNVSWSCIQKG
jgi:hypothetical protein